MRIWQSTSMWICRSTLSMQCKGDTKLTPSTIRHCNRLCHKSRVQACYSVHHDEYEENTYLCWQVICYVMKFDLMTEDNLIVATGLEESKAWPFFFFLIPPPITDLTHPNSQSFCLLIYLCKWSSDLSFSILVWNEAADKKIVHSCCAFGCRNRMGEHKGLGFFLFLSRPEEKKWREKWIRAVRRKNWWPTKFSQICGNHFTTGKQGNF